MSVDIITEPKRKNSLEDLGLEGSDKVHWNLSPAELYEQAIIRNEAILTKNHALRVLTGTYTGRSPKDKFIVDQPSIHNDIDWGEINQPISEEVFDNLFEKTVDYLQDKDLFVKDLFAEPIKTTV